MAENPSATQEIQAPVEDPKKVAGDRFAHALAQSLKTTGQLPEMDDDVREAASVAEVLFGKQKDENKVNVEKVKSILFLEKNLAKLKKQINYWLDNRLCCRNLKDAISSKTIEGLIDYLLNDKIFLLDLESKTQAPSLEDLRSDEKISIAFCSALESYYSLRDPLTNLWGRQAFEIYFTHQVEVEGKTPILVYLDLNDFKAINDDENGGHLVGDLVLQTFAQAGKDVFKNQSPSSLICRLSGDEFALLFLVDQLDNNNQESVKEMIVQIVIEIQKLFIKMLLEIYKTKIAKGEKFLNKELIRSINFSVGAFADGNKHSNMRDLQYRADTYLYESKARKEKKDPSKENEDANTILLLITSYIFGQLYRQNLRVPIDA